MIDYQGETYLSVTDIARHLGISRPTCYNNVLPLLQKYALPGRKQALYWQEEVEQFAGIRTERTQSASPTCSASTEEARDAGGTHHEVSEKVVWQGQYSPVNAQMQERTPAP